MRYIQQKNTPRRSPYLYEQNVPTKNKKHRFLISGFIALSILVLLGFAVNRFTRHNVAEDALIAIGIAEVKGQEAEAVPPKTPSLDEAAKIKMKEAIEQALASKSAIDASVSIVDIKTGDTYNYGYDGVYLGASVNKLLTATLLLKQVDQGKLTLNTTIQGQKASTLLTRLIVNSDNNAWATLNTYLTSKALRQWAKDNGLLTYNFDTNEIAPVDPAKLLASLYGGNLLTKQSTDVLLAHMKNANETNHIVANVPAGISVYHKAGWLDDHVHDAAIIDDGNRPYILVIFTEGVGIYSGGKTNTLYAAVTQATLDAFTTKAEQQ